MPRIGKSKVTVDGNEWVSDKLCAECQHCRQLFTMRRRRHHCRKCGHIFCAACSDRELQLPIAADGQEAAGVKPQRVCRPCFFQIRGTDGTESWADLRVSLGAQKNVRASLGLARESLDNDDYDGAAAGTADGHLAPEHVRQRADSKSSLSGDSIHSPNARISCLTADIARQSSPPPVAGRADRRRISWLPDTVDANGRLRPSMAAEHVVDRYNPHVPEEPPDPQPAAEFAPT